MSAFLLPLTVFLAAVFGASAVGKLRSADHGRSAFAALRVPVRRPGIAAATLIAVEAVVAIGLVVTTGGAFVALAVAALVLSAGLSLAVLRAHRLGATDDCGCFGTWLPAPIGPRLVVRNLVLTVIAACVLAAAVLAVLASAPLGVPAILVAGPSAVVAVSAIGSGLLIAAGVWSIVGAARPLPSPAGSTPRGSGALLRVDTAEIIDVLAPAERARLLVFVSPGCHACAAALESLHAASAPLDAVVDLYVVQTAVRGSATAQWTHDLPASARFALDVGGSVGERLGTGLATPVAALIGTDGAQAGPLALGSEEIDMLIGSLRAVSEAPPV